MRRIHYKHLWLELSDARPHSTRSNCQLALGPPSFDFSFATVSSRVAALSNLGFACAVVLLVFGLTSVRMEAGRRRHPKHSVKDLQFSTRNIMLWRCRGGLMQRLSKLVCSNRRGFKIPLATISSLLFHAPPRDRMTPRDLVDQSRIS